MIEISRRMKHMVAAAAMVFGPLVIATNLPWFEKHPYTVTVTDKLIIPDRNASQLTVIYVENDTGTRGDFSASPATYSDAHFGVQYILSRPDPLVSWQWLTLLAMGVSMFIGVIWAINIYVEYVGSTFM